MRKALLSIRAGAASGSIKSKTIVSGGLDTDEPMKMQSLVEYIDAALAKPAPQSMTTELRELLREARDELDATLDIQASPDLKQFIERIDAALAEPEPEPVGFHMTADNVAVIESSTTCY